MVPVIGDVSSQKEALTAIATAVPKRWNLKVCVCGRLIIENLVGTYDVRSILDFQ